MRAAAVIGRHLKVFLRCPTNSAPVSIRSGVCTIPPPPLRWLPIGAGAVGSARYWPTAVWLQRCVDHKCLI